MDYEYTIRYAGKLHSGWRVFMQAPWTGVSERIERSQVMGDPKSVKTYFLLSNILSLLINGISVRAEKPSLKP